MYSNDPKQIRNGLVGYIGALLKAVPYEEKPAKQLVVAALLEESMTLGLKNEENIEVDMYILKPFFRGCKTILEKRILELETISLSSKSINSQIDEYKNIISSLNKIIDSIK